MTWIAAEILLSSGFSNSLLFFVSNFVNRVLKIIFFVKKLEHRKRFLDRLSNVQCAQSIRCYCIWLRLDDFNSFLWPNFRYSKSTLKNLISIIWFPNVISISFISMNSRVTLPITVEEVSLTSQVIPVQYSGSFIKMFWINGLWSWSVGVIECGIEFDVICFIVCKNNIIIKCSDRHRCAVVILFIVYKKKWKKILIPHSKHDLNRLHSMLV